jgi:hypothetical protein
MVAGNEQSLKVQARQVSEPVTPERGAGADARRRRLFRRLPVVAGAGALVLIWFALSVAVSSNDGSCLGGMSLQAVGDALSYDLPFVGDHAFAGTLALLAYAGVSFIPFLLLWGCVLLTARASSTRFLAVQAITGVALISIYYALGYAAAYPDLVHGGMLCDLLFDLVPLGGVVAGAGAIVVGSLTALVFARQRSASS